MLRQLLWICCIICIWKTNDGFVFYPDYNQCTSEPCGAIDSALRKYVNLDLEPCDNFYKYACSNNITSVDYDTTSHSRTFHSTGNQDLDDFNDILSDTFIGSNISPDQLKTLKTEREIFKRCKTNYNNIAEMNEYDRVLESCGAHRLRRDQPDSYYRSRKNDASWSVQDSINAKSGIGFAFFEVNIVSEQPDIYRGNSQTRYIQISPSEDDHLAISELMHEYYNLNTTSGSTIPKYAKLKSFIHSLNGIPTNIHVEGSDSELGTKYTIEEWQREWDNHGVNNGINWQDILRTLFHVVPYPVDRKTTILIKNKLYFDNLANLLHNEMQPTILDYVHFRFISKTIGYVNSYYRKYALVPAIDDGFHCTPGLMVGTAYAYMQKYFPKDNQEILNTMFTSVKSHVIRKLGSDGENIDATSEPTRIFLRLLKDSKAVIGYPQWVVNETIVANFYGRNIPTISDLYISNQLNMLKASMEIRLKPIVDHSMPIFDMNAFFKSIMLKNIQIDNDLKEIVIPGRFFNEHTYQYFSSLLYHPINYGAAGTMIAYNLYETYLKKISYERNATKCARANVGGFHDSKRDSRLIESTAWLLALNTSYEIWPEKESYPIEFSKFGAIADTRLFFISFAQSVCQIPSSGPEDGPAAHINFAVENSYGFQRAFVCDSSHLLYKRVKCNPLEYS